jgi:hypothetical protein
VINRDTVLVVVVPHARPYGAKLSITGVVEAVGNTQIASVPAYTVRNDVDVGSVGLIKRVISLKSSDAVAAEKILIAPDVLSADPEVCNSSHPGVAAFSLSY